MEGSKQLTLAEFFSSRRTMRNQPAPEVLFIEVDD